MRGLPALPPSSARSAASATALAISMSLSPRLRFLDTFLTAFPFRSPGGQEGGGLLSPGLPLTFLHLIADTEGSIVKENNCQEDQLSLRNLLTRDHYQVTLLKETPPESPTNCHSRGLASIHTRDLGPEFHCHCQTDKPTASQTRLAARIDR
jgi:hypothetical protein